MKINISLSSTTPFGKTNHLKDGNVRAYWSSYQRSAPTITNDLRIGGKSIHNSFIQNLDKDMRPSIQDATLYRGFRVDDVVLDDWLKNPKQLIGRVFFDPSYDATSLSKNIASDFASGILLTLKAPKGTLMLSMAKALETDTSDYYHKEQAYILARNTKMRIVKARVESEFLYGRYDETMHLLTGVVK